MDWPLSVSHTRASPSCPPVAIRVPSELYAMLTTGPVWPENVVRSFPVCASHEYTSRPAAVATRVPSGLKATAPNRESDRRGRSVEISPVFRSQIGVRAHPGLVTLDPSALKAGV